MLSESVIVPAPFFVSPPVPDNEPDCVIAPALSTVNSVETLLAARSNPPSSRTETVAPLVMPTVLKTFDALFSVMLFAAPAASVAAPVTANAPLCVIAPLVVTPKVPLTVDAPRISALLSVSDTLLPVVMITVLKSFDALLNVTLLPAPAATVVVPGTTIAPVKFTAPPDVMPRFFPEPSVSPPEPETPAPVVSERWFACEIAALTVTAPLLLLPICSVPAVMRSSSASVSPRVSGLPVSTSAPPRLMKVPAVRVLMVVVAVPLLMVPEPPI